MNKKICTRCNSEKSVDNFDKHESTKDKLQNWCRDCKNARRRELRKLKVGCYANEYQNNRESHLATCKRRNMRHREMVISHYSPKKCCTSCGFSDMRALSIDHINGDGANHRRELKGKSFYKWLIDNKYPRGFQVLCMNCQFIKRHEQNEYRTHDPSCVQPYKRTTKRQHRFRNALNSG